MSNYLIPYQSSARWRVEAPCRCQCTMIVATAGPAQQQTAAQPVCNVCKCVSVCEDCEVSWRYYTHLARQSQSASVSSGNQAWPVKCEYCGEKRPRPHTVQCCCCSRQVCVELLICIFRYPLDDISTM